MLKETNTNRWYYLADDTEIEVKWSEEYGDTKVVIENEKKKGIIKVIKTDDDFKEYKLENVEFEIYDEDNNYIEKVKTNNEGIAESSRLRIDKKYYFYESMTKQNYILDDKVHKVDFIGGLTNEEINNIQNDIIYTINLENKHQKGNLSVYKVDADNNEIPLENVEFELYVKNVDSPYRGDELIGTYTTNSKGEIRVDDLWTGEYYLKEVSGSPCYKLNTEEIPVIIKDNEIAEIMVQNERIKGQVRVIKVDKDDNGALLSGVEFDILDSEMNVVDSIVTDENR